MSGSRKGIPNKISRYDTDILPRLSDIKEWLMQGDTVREICKKLEMSPDTWYRYCREHETLTELVTMGRSVLCNEVEKSLIKLCTGYDYEELKTTVEEDKNGKKRTKIEKTKRHQPPSAQAISFFLRNRMPEEWSDKKEIILDTSQNDETRKRLFLEMINSNAIEGEYTITEGQDNQPKNEEDIGNNLMSSVFTEINASIL
ncbi:MAG: hypothetical protein PHX14_07035 [Syntrophomonadaceae bacterium]|nr:hypothetical protein [Syntrophomonadaceae bacterium]